MVAILKAKCGWYITLHNNKCMFPSLHCIVLIPTLYYFYYLWYHIQIPYTPKYKPVITFISRNMISDDELLDHDTSDDLTLVRNTPQEDSSRIFSHHLINCLGLSSKERTETANNNTQLSECYGLDAMCRGKKITFNATTTINDPGRYINHASKNQNLQPKCTQFCH